MQLPSFQNVLKAWLPRGMARMLSLLIFFVPFALLQLIGWDQLLVINDNKSCRSLQRVPAPHSATAITGPSTGSGGGR